MRMSNLAAAAARPQIWEVQRRARKGRANHDYLAAILNASPWLDVPAPLAGEVRAPDSIQFNLMGFGDDAGAEAFQRVAEGKGVQVQIIGLSRDNARAFWNWEFIGPRGDSRRRARCSAGPATCAFPSGWARPSSTSSGRRWWALPRR
jgi:hypothetical protein